MKQWRVGKVVPAESEVSERDVQSVEVGGEVCSGEKKVEAAVEWREH